MTAERIRLLVACVAVAALVEAAFLFRHAMYIVPRERPVGYLLDRWTGAVTLIEGETKIPVLADDAK